jgi:type II secretory pathway predicted ATPase ExeA
MYLDHFNLNEKPFEPTSDSKYIWLSNENVTALKTFRQSLINDEGRLILSGDTGSGKSAWMRYFLRLISPTTLVNVLWQILQHAFVYVTNRLCGFDSVPRQSARAAFQEYGASLAE